MSYKPKSLYRIIEDIDAGHLFLPHIQRPFVWEVDQMRRLFDSLMRNYPIQTLLFWRTRDAIKARRFMQSVDWDADLHEYYDENKSSKDVEKVFVLDGQQRLQTLYALFNGSIRSDGNQSIPEEAYVDISCGDEISDEGLRYRIEFSCTPLGFPFLRVRDLLGKYNQKNAEEIADEINDEMDRCGLSDEQGDVAEARRKARQKRVRRNVSQLLSILREEKYFWVQELDGVANDYPYRRILEIFVRVNSGGTKLDSADLMFAAMKEGWAEIEEHIEDVVNLLNDSRLSFDKGFALKCIVVALGKGAELKPEKFTQDEGENLLRDVEANWQRIEDGFRQLRDFIVQDLKLYGDKVVRSYSSFVPLFDYLYHSPSPDERNRALMRAYYYKSQLFNWYGAQTDSTINTVHNVLGTQKTDFPLARIKEHFAKRQDVEFGEQHLANSRIRFIILNLVYVQVFGNSPFNVVYKGSDPHVDHIYPQSPLRTRLGLGTAEINNIGNLRLYGATDNIRKRAEMPATYFSRMRASGVDIQKHLLIQEYASYPERLKFDVTTYRTFRDKRLAAILDISRRVINPERP